MALRQKELEGTGKSCLCCEESENAFVTSGNLGQGWAGLVCSTLTRSTRSLLLHIAGFGWKIYNSASNATEGLFIQLYLGLSCDLHLNRYFNPSVEWEAHSDLPHLHFPLVKKVHLGKLCAQIHSFTAFLKWVLWAISQDTALYIWKSAVP